MLPLSIPRIELPPRHGTGSRIPHPVSGPARFEIVPFLLLILLSLLSPHSVLARVQPQSEDTLLFREGELLFSKGELEKALWRFKRIVLEHPQSSLLNEAKLRMGVCYTQLKRPQEAIRVLQEVLSSFLPPPKMVYVFSLLGENSLELKDRFSAVHWYGKALLVPGQPQRELKKKIRTIIDTFEKEEDLKRIESLYRGAYGGGYAKWRWAQLARLRGKDLLARQLLEEWEKEYDKADYLSETGDTEPVQRAGRSRFTIGILLPLSGPHQPYGESVLQGIQLAFKDLSPSAKDPAISLTVRDTKGDPAEAERIVQDLVNKENPMALLGPLLSIEVERASRRARQLRIPMITFSQKEFQPSRNGFVFYNCLLPSDQIEALVAFAIKNRGLKSFGIFYPNSPYGLHLKNLFAQEVVHRGGKIFGAMPYREGETDFSQEIKGFFKIEPVQEQDSPKKRWGEAFRSTVTVDGLFIPDAHDRIGLILAQMAYYDVEGVTFLGTNVWNGPDLVPVAGKAAEGAIFTDAFFKKSGAPLCARFVEAFQSTYRRDPETLDALGYDAAKLLIEILRSRSVSSPLQLNDELLKIQNFQGVSGLKGFREGGRPVRTFLILQINKGQVELVTPQ